MIDSLKSFFRTVLNTLESRYRLVEAVAAVGFRVYLALTALHHSSGAPRKIKTIARNLDFPAVRAYGGRSS